MALGSTVEQEENRRRRKGTWLCGNCEAVYGSDHPLTENHPDYDQGDFDGFGAIGSGYATHRIDPRTGETLCWGSKTGDREYKDPSSGETTPYPKTSSSQRFYLYFS